MVIYSPGGNGVGAYTDIEMAIYSPGGNGVGAYTDIEMVIYTRLEVMGLVLILI